MLKAVLFDLDNTLLFLDEMEFFQNYLSQISPAFTDLMPIEVFQQKLIFSTRAFMKNNGEMLNKEFFLNVFSEGLGVPREEIWNRFLDFYTVEFDQLGEMATLPEGGREVLLRLQEKRLKLVIASNPVWPQMVQRKRLAWAGIEDLDYALVTSIENMSFCKPRLEYFREICTKIGVEPEECLMVGNDPVNDMMGANLGMKTFLVLDGEGDERTSLSLSRKVREDKEVEVPAPDYRGKLAEVLEAVDALMEKL